MVGKRYRDLVLQYKPKVRMAGDIEDIEFRKSIMLIALRAKFEIPMLREYLLSTGDLILREKSNDVWSVVLGELLMQLRSEIRSETSQE